MCIEVADDKGGCEGVKVQFKEGGEAGLVSYVVIEVDDVPLFSDMDDIQYLYAWVRAEVWL